jgi:RNA polymerase subunit RPABC4/transcription elongation factor Spt4
LATLPPVALSTCPECRKGISDKASNCPHCGWHKSRAGLVAAWIIAIVIIALGVLFYYEINESNKAFAELRKQNEKADRMIKALKP